MAGAVIATIERPGALGSVADDLAAAMGANGRQDVDRTLEGIEQMRTALHDYFEAVLVFIAARITSRHGVFFLPGFHKGRHLNSSTFCFMT